MKVCALFLSRAARRIIPTRQVGGEFSISKYSFSAGVAMFDQPYGFLRNY